MSRRLHSLPAVCLLLVLFAPLAAKTWLWYKDLAWPTYGSSNQGKYLTGNNGAHAVAVQPYLDGAVWRHWVTIAGAISDTSDGRIRCMEYSDLFPSSKLDEVVVRNDGPGRSDYPCVATNPRESPQDDDWKHVAAAQTGGCSRAWTARRELTDTESAWPVVEHTEEDYATSDTMITIGTPADGSGMVYVVWIDYDPEGEEWAVLCKWSAHDGEVWSDPVEVAGSDEFRLTCPSVATSDGGNVYAAWGALTENGDKEVYFSLSTDCGNEWSDEPTPLVDGSESKGWRPCVAALDDLVLVCWTVEEGSHLGEIAYRYSTNAGAEWTPGFAEDPALVPFSSGNGRTYAKPNIAMWRDTRPWIVLTCATYDEASSSVAYDYAFLDGDWQWVKQRAMQLPYVGGPQSDDRYNPSLSISATDHDTVACIVWSDQAGYPSTIPIARQV